ELNQLAVQRTRSVGQMVKSAISAVGNIVAGTLSAFPVTGGVLPNAAGSAQAFTAATVAFADIGIEADVQGLLDESEQLTQELYENSAVQILQSMSDAATSAMALAGDGMNQIQVAQLDALRAQNALSSVTSAASYELGKV